MVVRPTGFPLPKDERHALRKFVQRVGERQACSELGLTSLPLARALAGLTIARGTLALLRAGLASLKTEAS